MALTQKQIEGLNAATTRIMQGKDEGDDIKNVMYARDNLGYDSTKIARSFATTPKPTPSPTTVETPVGRVDFPSGTPKTGGGILDSITDKRIVKTRTGSMYIIDDANRKLYSVNSADLPNLQGAGFTVSEITSGDGNKLDTYQINRLPDTTTITPTDTTDTTIKNEIMSLEESNRIIDEAIKAGQISLQDADLFKEMVKNFQGTNLNYNTIINEFKKIRETTIDTEFALRARQFERDLEVTKSKIEKQKADELEAIGVSEDEAVEQAQESLEASGMTFSGKGVEVLGEKSAISPEKMVSTLTDPQGTVKFAAKGTPEYEELISQGFNEKALEGKIEQKANLLRTSAEARSTESFQNLLTGVEDIMGTERAKATGVTGQLAGGITGTEEAARRKTEAGTLTNLATLQKQAEDARKKTQINLNQ